MEQYKNLHYLVEEIIKFGHLKQYVCAPADEAKKEQPNIPSVSYNT